MATTYGNVRAMNIKQLRRIAKALLLSADLGISKSTLVTAIEAA